MSHERPPLLALSAGEPAGIGPDIVAALATRDLPARLVCFADPDVIDARAQAIGIALTIERHDSLDTVPSHRAGRLVIAPETVARSVVPGQLDGRNAAYVLRCLDRCIDAAARGAAQAIVTAPVHKAAIIEAGHAFTGHTEYLASHFPPAVPVMMLASDTLRVALATTHLALRDVPQALEIHRLAYVISTVANAMRTRYRIAHPRIAVCGLNPHAGENGHFGTEERDVIEPAIAAAAGEDVTILGPLPADTAFAPTARAGIDAFIAMYHDQGLPVIKALSFGAVVNITLGLPVVRTSVDHGTALDLAGTGRADAGSLQAAVEAAIALSVAP